MPYKKITSMGNAWNFEENDTLEGTYFLKKENVGPNKSNMYYIKDGEGIDRAVWGTTALDNQMSFIEQGNRIEIKYLGEVVSPKTNRKYKNFEVSIWESE